ncbi:hypothetical protein [Mucilaginibacter psychrotolerans]|uniref:DUF4595 domain-containing protein n=1 Tax=Mucilaginibacter psychrotolerans TaxID=1524096 RepID=A0A4Y8S4U9_9SPHI|nr:hypothetical protein [Mucilaginibacter psychrotolerans]TFF33590.1 hypothetical protein E2R66_25280 [Mucilaginibacter psychrotolerans]
MSRLIFYALCLVSIGSLTTNPSIAQTDFESKASRKIIVKYKIKEIVSYLSPEEGKPGDSIPVDNMFFDKHGVCIRKTTNNYTDIFYYNSKKQKVKQVYIGKNQTDSTVIIFEYDDRGNMILSKKIRTSQDDKFKDLYFIHQFTYNSDNEVLTDVWIDRKGEIQNSEKREYFPAEPNSGIQKVVKYYDMYGRAYQIKKSYTDCRIITYDIGDTVNTVSYEQFLDKDQKIVKVINHRHFGPHAFDMVEKMGHGIIPTTTVTEFYRYNEYGLCSERSTYREGKLIEKQTWYYRK